MENNVDLQAMGQEAKKAARQIAQASTEQKNEVLEILRASLYEQKDKIMAANYLDMKEGKEAGLSSDMLDRLSLEGRLEGIAEDIQTVIQLADPVGEVFEKNIFPNGLRVEKQRTPIGVLGIIYESRPNVTIDVATLAIKSGNAAILRGGSETIHSNRILAKTIQEALHKAGLSEKIIQFIDNPDRGLVKELLLMHPYIDLIIPRGGAGLHRFCRENSTIPVITGGIGICHLYVDEGADAEAAIEKSSSNAKTQRPSVCNALETLLVHRKMAAQFIPKLFERLSQSGVSIRADREAWELLPSDSSLVKRANEESDWDKEWLDLILGIKIVEDLDEAIAHIQTHSSGHSDGILTNQKEHAKRFVKLIDSAAVYVNASTRFTDGGQFGLGAEVAVSTQLRC